MKVVVVGCTHAGTAAVTNIRENYPDSEVIIYEKNNNDFSIMYVSLFLFCAKYKYTNNIRE